MGIKFMVCFRDVLDFYFTPDTFFMAWPIYESLYSLLLHNREFSF